MDSLDIMLGGGLPENFSEAVIGGFNSKRKDISITPKIIERFMIEHIGLTDDEVADYRKQAEAIRNSFFEKYPNLMSGINIPQEGE